MTMISQPTPARDSSRPATACAWNSASWLPRVPSLREAIEVLFLALSIGGQLFRRVQRRRGGGSRRLTVIEPEQAIDRLRVGGLGLLVGQRFELFGGLEQQLLDDEARHFVDPRPGVRRQPRQARLEPLHFRAADVVEPLAER